MEHLPFKTGIITGSLRRDSFSLKMAHCVMKLYPSFMYELISLCDLTLYNEDLETDTPPEGWKNFRESVKDQDAILFITPEYNRSVPAVLKNAIDIGSAPHGRNVFNRKPTAVISLSPGKMGAFGANHHLRQSLVFLNMPVMQQPEAYLGESGKLIGGDGMIANQVTEDFLRGFMEEFQKWVALHSSAEKY